MAVVVVRADSVLSGVGAGIEPFTDVATRDAGGYLTQREPQPVTSAVREFTTALPPHRSAKSLSLRGDPLAPGPAQGHHQGGRHPPERAHNHVGDVRDA